MSKTPPRWRTAIRGRDDRLFIAAVGVPHLSLMQTMQLADFGPVSELGFVDEAGRFHNPCEAQAACGAAHAFTMRYPSMLRRFLAWCERRPIRYFYATLTGSLALTAAAIAWCYL